MDGLGTHFFSSEKQRPNDFPNQDYRIEKKWSAVGFCSGAIAGLVAITPGSGFVGSREEHFSRPGTTS
jgi:hypothetical protein